jgi:repressor of nif and glnA expression
MIGSGSIEVERKEVAILRALNESPDTAIGARVIARELEKQGINLTERAVRYHLKLMDERGLTQSVGRDGRQITPAGVEELRNALVADKVGLFSNRIELVSFRTTFDWRNVSGFVPSNLSLFNKRDFPQALTAMRSAFKAGICVGDLVAVASEGETLADRAIPKGKVGFATVCSTIVAGALLKAGVPMSSRFGGILQIRDYEPLRFVELIHYSGTSLDPSEVLIRGKMTNVSEAAKKGEGKVLANYAEIPAQCKSLGENMIARLKEARLGSLAVMGNVGDSVCEVPVEPNRIGVILFGGLNPVAAAEEAGIEADNTSICSVIDYGRLTSFWGL